jgi:hypothetical protein
MMWTHDLCPPPFVPGIDIGAGIDLRTMSMELPLRLGRMWWAGFKVLCRWCAFGIVLSVLWLPLAGLTRLVGDHVGRNLGIALTIVIAPIPFYLTSRYLLLLGDEDQAEAGPRKVQPMSRRGKGVR